MTIIGTPTSGNDNLFVIGQGENLSALAGNDTLDASGGDGNNTLDGGEGDDELYANENDSLLGGEDNDTLDATGGQGNNTLDGGEGDDELEANENDSLLGGQGEDKLSAVGIGGNNSLNGGDDNDQLFAVEGNNNLLVGEIGNDQLYVIEGSFNTLQGGDDNDFLRTSSTTGNNTLQGGEGSDTLVGFVATDSLVGGAGDDYLYAGKLGTQMRGEGGLDRFYLGNGEIPDEPAVINDFTKGDDKVVFAGISQVTAFENIILEQDGDDTLVKVEIDSVEVTFGILIGITATDLDASDFDFLLPAFSITEAATEGSDLVFTVTRSDDFLTEQTVTVSTSISIASGDTATQDDFISTSQTLTFAQGDTSKTFTVQTTEDSVFENDETFTVSLTDATGGAIIDDTQTTATGTINNDDDAPVFSIAAAQATEGENIVFTVTRTGDAQPEQTVTVSTSIAGGDTATQDDFTANTDTILTFAQGETSQTFTVATTEDILLEDDETFTVSLTDATGGAIIDDAQSTATGTIIDNDPSVFSIAAAAATEGNDLVFTVTRTGDTSTEQEVQVSAFVGDGDTASEDDDFTPKPETLTFAQGETSKEFKVETIEDFLVEEDETFTVSLNSTTGETISTAQGTIIDDDNILSFNNNIFSISILEEFVALKAVLTSSISNVVNEIGVVFLDDENGTIDGVGIEDAEYNAKFLERIRDTGKSRSLFSILDNLPTNFRSAFESESLFSFLEFESELNATEHIQFFLVNDGTIDEYLAGDISDSSILFTESFSQIIQEESSFTISFRESTTTTEFNSLVVRLESVSGFTTQEQFLTEITQFQGSPEGELIDLTGYDSVTANFSVFREASFDNEVYFYIVDNETGTLQTASGTTIEATAANRTAYIQEVINNRLVTEEFSVENQGEVTGTITIPGGSIIAPMIIINGSLDELTDGNANNDPEVYFPFLGVNSDGADHIRVLGDNIFGFEDLPNGGDKDYNDIIVSLEFTNPNIV